MTKYFLTLLTAGMIVLPVTSSASADELSPWQVRVRGIAVVPDESAKITVIGGDASIDTDYVPELDISYFFTENIALELILATTKHNAVAVGTALGDVPLGSVHLLPPTLTLQYHFNLGNGVKPYVGAGINYTFFFDANPAGGAVTGLAFDNGVGIALQAGVDIAINEHWMFNIDLKKLWLNTDASINGGAIEADIDVDPWILGTGFGYRF